MIQYRLLCLPLLEKQRSRTMVICNIDVIIYREHESNRIARSIAQGNASPTNRGAAKGLFISE